MGNKVGRECSGINGLIRRASDLAIRYQNLKGKHRTLSLKTLRHSEISMLSKDDERKSEDIDGQLRKTFPSEKEIDFRGFLKWEIAKGGSAEEVAKKLESLFREVDDGDGLLDPEELVNLEAALDRTLTEEQAEAIIRNFDTNGVGRMTLDDFIFYHTTTKCVGSRASV